MDINIKLKNNTDERVNRNKIYLLQNKSFSELEKNVFHLVESKENNETKKFEISEEVFEDLKKLLDLRVEKSDIIYIQTIDGRKEFEKGKYISKIEDYYCGKGEKSFKCFIQDLSNNVLVEIKKEIFNKL